MQSNQGVPNALVTGVNFHGVVPRLWEGAVRQPQNESPELQAALEQEVVVRPEGEAAAFWQREWARLDEKLVIRNRSILAHGGDRVSQAGWRTLSEWTETGLLQLLAREAERLGEAHDMPQLPAALPGL